MKYLATIITGIDTFSMTFDTVKDAMNWLDQNNNNGELTTTIEEYNDKWEKVDGFFYTEEKK